MSNADYVDFQQLVKAIDPGMELLHVQPLHGGLSAQATALNVALQDGRQEKLLVRRPSAEALLEYPDACVNEFKLLTFLYASGLKVPKPVYLDNSGNFFGTPNITLAFINGAVELSPKDISNYIQQLALQMAAFHLLPLTNEILAVKKRAPELPGSTDAACNTEEIKTLALLRNMWPLPSKNVPVLIHGDYWPGNVIWENDQLAAVIDWEDAGIGDPLLDLAIARLDILLLFGQEAMSAFTQVYAASTQTDLSTLPHWDLWASTRLIGAVSKWASVYPGLGRPDVTETLIRGRHRYFMEQAFAKMQ